jgi:hypothetical protein
MHQSSATRHAAFSKLLHGCTVALALNPSCQFDPRTLGILQACWPAQQLTQEVSHSLHAILKELLQLEHKAKEFDSL